MVLKKCLLSDYLTSDYSIQTKDSGFYLDNTQINGIQHRRARPSIGFTAFFLSWYQRALGGRAMSQSHFRARKNEAEKS